MAEQAGDTKTLLMSDKWLIFTDLAFQRYTFYSGGADGIYKKSSYVFDYSHDEGKVSLIKSINDIQEEMFTFVTSA